MPKIIKAFLIFIAIILVIFLLVASAYFWMEQTYTGRMFPGEHIGKIYLSGQTVDEAKNILNQQIDNLSDSGIGFVYKDNKAAIYPVVSRSANGDLIDIYISFDTDKTIADAYEYGRSGDLIKRTAERLLLLSKQKSANLVFETNDEKIKSTLEQSFSAVESADAKYAMQGGQLTIIKERTGKKLNYEDGLEELKQKLSRMDFREIVLRDDGDGVPTINEADCAQMMSNAQTIVDLAPITLKYSGRTWSLNQETLADWIVVNKNSSGLSLSLNKTKINDYLEKEIEPKIDSPATPPKFSIKAGKIQKIEQPKTGLALNIYLAVETLANLPNNHLKQLNLEVNRLLAADEKISKDFGIKEKIGSASTQIIDSTEKRIFNIKQGSSLIDGILIAPNEEFSLLKYLSPFDETNGYIKELVIQGGKLVPDYGGGLCQLSTTVFRAVMDTGLPITERVNHSYWLHYYSPPGTDATIFDPSPDLKFVNDTKNYILINAHVDAELNLIIDFWGTQDGRIASRTEPVVSNIVYAGTRIIRTASLPTGVKSCPTTAYNGADAYFNYKVVYADGTIKQTRFDSHYTPHAAICYVGY
jgi:vancomycin resistance protein YoaR